MRTCPSCGRENPDDKDFCECGEYLRWDPTRHEIPAIKPPDPAPAPPPAAPQEPAAPQYLTRPQQAAAPRQPAPPPPPQQQQPPPPVAPTLRRQPAAPPPQPVGPPAAAAVTLRLPEGESSSADGPVGLAVVPGERATVIALVRNQSSIVDNYDLTVHGLPREWWTAAPDTVYLVPFGTAGSYEQEILITLHPPRTPEAEARRWELQVGIHSRAANTEVARAPLTLGILPFEDYAVTVAPQRRSGRRRARYDVRLTNNANAAGRVALDAADTDGECAFEFAADAIEVPLGETRTVRLAVRPPRQIWLGRPLERRFEVVSASGEAGEKLLAERVPGGGAAGRRRLPGGMHANAPRVQIGPGGIDVSGPQFQGPHVPSKSVDLSRPTLGLRALKRVGGEAPPPAPPPQIPSQAIFRQKPWLPWWLAIVAPLLLLLLLLLFLLLPKNVVVPDLRGSATVLEAQKKLTAVDLQLGRVTNVQTAKAKPGTVLDQAIKPGTKKPKNTAVDITVAVGTGSVKVPDVTGLTLDEADHKLRAKKLTPGATDPQDPKPDALIARTRPVAGESVPVGTAVELIYADAKPKAKPKDKGTAKTAGTGGAPAPGGGGGGGPLEVPPLKPADLAGYTAALQQAGLVRGTVTRQIDDGPVGAVVATNPPVGTQVQKGATVNVVVSLGFPLMAYDDDNDVLVADSGTGKTKLTVTDDKDAVEKDPTWSADGTRIVYTADQQLEAADVANLGSPPTALAAQDELFRDPSFAPQGKTLAVAKFNADNTDTDLCVGTVTAHTYSPDCIKDDSFQAGFAHWSPDGRTMLVSSVSQDKGYGVVAYHSDTPFSPNAADWGTGKPVLPFAPDGVREMAFSADGKQLAAAAALTSDSYEIYTTTADDLKLDKAKSLGVLGCKVTWLDNRWLAAVQLGADCDQASAGFGGIVRFTVDDPDTTTTIVQQGDNPAFRPPGG